MTFILIFIFCAIAQIFLPWWIIAVIAFVVGLIKSSSGWQAFASGFAAIALLWGIVASYSHFSTSGILTGKIAKMIFLPSPLLVILLAMLIGGLVAGLASTCGYQLRACFAESVEEGQEIIASDKG